MARKSKAKRERAAGDKAAKVKATTKEDKEAEPVGKDTSPTWTKTKCPVSREDFLKGAGNLVVEVDGQRQIASAREFSSGSFGWFLNGKLITKVNGKPCKVQMNCSFVVVGSKPAKPPKKKKKEEEEVKTE